MLLGGFTVQMQHLWQPLAHLTCPSILDRIPLDTRDSMASRRSANSLEVIPYSCARAARLVEKHSTCVSGSRSGKALSSRSVVFFFTSSISRFGAVSHLLKTNRVDFEENPVCLVSSDVLTSSKSLIIWWKKSPHTNNSLAYTCQTECLNACQSQIWDVLLTPSRFLRPPALLLSMM